MTDLGLKLTFKESNKKHIGVNLKKSPLFLNIFWIVNVAYVNII